MNLHRTFPYFYVAYPTSPPQPFEPQRAPTMKEITDYARKLAVSIDTSMAMSFAQNNVTIARTDAQYIFAIEPVRGKSFYGFSVGERVFLKVFLYNPRLVTRMIGLLRSGAIMQTAFDIFEAHLPYTLHLFADYNLAGMDYVRFSKVAFRLPLPSFEEHGIFQWGKERVAHWSQAEGDTVWESESVSDRFYSPLPRTSSTALEVDALTTDIMNLQDGQRQAGGKMVASLAHIWDDEKRRRKAEGSTSARKLVSIIPDASTPVTPREPLMPPTPRSEEASSLNVVPDCAPEVVSRLKSLISNIIENEGDDLLSALLVCELLVSVCLLNSLQKCEVVESPFAKPVTYSPSQRTKPTQLPFYLSQRGDGFTQVYATLPHEAGVQTILAEMIPATAPNVILDSRQHGASQIGAYTNGSLDLAAKLSPHLKRLRETTDKLPPKLPRFDLSLEPEVDVGVVMTQVEDIEANELLLWMQQQKNESDDEDNSDGECDAEHSAELHEVNMSSSCISGNLTPSRSSYHKTCALSSKRKPRF